MTLEMIGTQSIHPDYSNLHKILSREHFRSTATHAVLRPALTDEWWQTQFVGLPHCTANSCNHCCTSLRTPYHANSDSVDAKRLTEIVLSRDVT